MPANVNDLSPVRVQCSRNGALFQLINISPSAKERCFPLTPGIPEKECSVSSTSYSTCTPSTEFANSFPHPHPPLNDFSGTLKASQVNTGELRQTLAFISPVEGESAVIEKMDFQNHQHQLPLVLQVF